MSTLDERLAGRRLETFSDQALAILETDGPYSVPDQLRLSTERARRERSPVSSTRAVVVGVDVPFWNIVVLMVKWSLAAIPALLILTVVGMMASLFLAALLKAK